jgi:hypothetical protein
MFDIAATRMLMLHEPGSNGGLDPSGIVVKANV